MKETAEIITSKYEILIEKLSGESFKSQTKKYTILKNIIPENL